MGKSFTAGGNSKKAAGQERQEQQKLDKKAKNAKANEDVENSKWSVGSKDDSKKESAAAKKAAVAAKKAERDAQLALEEAQAGGKSKGSSKNASSKKSTPVKPSRGTLDLSQLDNSPSASSKGQSSQQASNLALNASGIDSALDALSLTASTADQDAGKIDRHPERRFKAAYAVFEEKRLPELENENPGLRRNQRVELCRKEFEKGPDNPFNQANAVVNSTREEMVEIARKERERKEGLLGGK